MSKTISFVASDKLVEWLEEESDRRMTTISTTAQQLLAEKYRQEHGDLDDSESAGSASSGESLPAVFERHEDRWYRPDSDEYDFAVRTPDNNRKYRKTVDGAAGLLERYYDGE